MAATTNFVAAQAANRRNTLLLLVVLTALAALFGYLIGWVLEGYVTDTVAAVSSTGLMAAAIMATASVGWSVISLAFGSRMVLAMADAKPIEKADAPQLFNVVEEMSIAAGVPMPKVMVMEVDALNAFATGTSTSNAAIVVTRGLLDTLNREELQGVIGHEMGAHRQPRHALHDDRRRHGRPDRPRRLHDPARAAMGQLQQLAQR